MKKLILLLISYFTLSSCERAMKSDTTKLTLVVPASQTDVLSTQKFVKSLNLGLLSTETNENQYNEIFPTGFTTVSGTTPINCYLVTVTAPEDFMNINYCGVDRGAGVERDLTFGTYVGLVRSNSEIVLNVPTGKNRKVMLFGFHVSDITECKDLRNNPQKNLMSFPYYVGSSERIDLDGSDKIVNVQLETPADSNRQDSCNIEAGSPFVSEATHTVYNDTLFPYNKLRIPNTVGFTCEELRFSFYNTPANFTVSSFLYEDRFVLQVGDGVSFTNRVTYGNYNSCASDTSQLSEERVYPTKISKNVWARFTLSDSWINQVRFVSLNRTDITATVKPVSLVSTPAASYSFDLLGLPTKLLNGQCYPFRVAIRNLFGELPTVIASSTLTIVPKFPSAGTAVGMTYSDPGCSSILPNITMGSNQSLSAPVYIKLEVATPTQELGVLEVTKLTGDAGLLAYNVPFRVVHQATTTPVLSKIFLTGFSSGNNIVLNGVDRCVPVAVIFQDQNGLPVLTTAADNIEFLPPPESDLSGVSLYGDQTCSSNLNTGSLSIGAGKVSYVFFLDALSSSTLGQRKLAVRVNNAVKYFTFHIRQN
jgi:hypothetical protein